MAQIRVKKRKRGGTPDVARHRLVVREYLSGVTMAQVGRALGITRQRVQQILIKAGVPRRGPAHYAEQRLPASQVLKLHHRGMTLQEIAAALDFSVETVSKRLRKRGVRPNRKPLKFTVEQVRQFQKLMLLPSRKRGMTVPQIISRYGIDQGTLYRIRWGVHPHQR